LSTIHKIVRLIAYKLSSAQIFLFSKSSSYFWYFKDFFGLSRFILKQIYLFRLFLCTFSVWFGSFWNKFVCFSCFNVHVRFFGSFWNKTVCFGCFENSFETPKQTETRSSLVLKMNRNKWETDPVPVIFGLNATFFYLFRGHPTHGP